MAELADAPDLGSGVYDVQVQVLSSAGDGWSGSDFRKEIGFGSFFCIIGYQCQKVKKPFMLAR